MQRYGPRTALVVVDVQNDFADPKGSLSVTGGEGTIPVVNGQAAGAPAARAVGGFTRAGAPPPAVTARAAAATAAGAFVVYTQDWHPAHTPPFAQYGGIWPVHCVG